MYNSSNGIIVSLLLAMIDDSTGTVIWPITMSVIFRSVVIYLLVW
jgi:hypothetical protein